MNKVILCGNVGKDPTIRRTNSGSAIASFSLATSERWRDKATGERREQTDWHNIVIYNENLVKIVEQYVSKGSKILIEGKTKTRKYTDKEGSERYTTEIVLGNFDGAVHLLGDKGGGGDRPESDREGYGTTRTREGSSSFGRESAGFDRGGSSVGREIDDEIPF